MRAMFRRIRRRINNHPLLAGLGVMIIIYLIMTFIIMHFENISFRDAVMMSMPAFLGELGIVDSKSPISQAAMLLSLLLNITIIALITAKITSEFIDLLKKGGRIVTKVRTENHIIVCGWNFQGEKIINELTKSNPNCDIVILAQLDKRPDIKGDFDFINGDPTQDDDLERAGIKKAASVIILTDFTASANEVDARALMITLAVESLNRKTHTCVQIMNSENRIHFERANADEIICLDMLGSNMVVTSAVNHGISKVVGELLSFNEGSEFYRYNKPLSDKITGKTFSEAVKYLAEDNIILIGVETDNTDEIKKQMRSDVLHMNVKGDKVILVNPVNTHYIKPNDVLFLISETMPKHI